MNLYEETKQRIEAEQEQLKALGGIALTAMERADMEQTRGVIAEILGAEHESTVSDSTRMMRTEAGNWVITLDDAFEFRKMPGYQVEARMLPTICTKGCHDFIGGREDFVNFMRNHLSHPDHTPSQKF